MREPALNSLAVGKISILNSRLRIGSIQIILDPQCSLSISRQGISARKGPTGRSCASSSSCKPRVSPGGLIFQIVDQPPYSSETQPKIRSARTDRKSNSTIAGPTGGSEWCHWMPRHPPSPIAASIFDFRKRMQIRLAIELRAGDIRPRRPLRKPPLEIIEPVKPVACYAETHPGDQPTWRPYA